MKTNRDHSRLSESQLEDAALAWLKELGYAVAHGPHIALFVNGLPLAVIELKNAAGADATVWSAYAQLQTYKAEIPALLGYNAVLVASDGVTARVGSITADQEWFKVWREIDDSFFPSTTERGDGDAIEQAQKGSARLELQTLLGGVFARRPQGQT